MTTTIDLPALPFLDIRGDAFRDNHERLLGALHEQGPLARSERGIEVLSYDLVAQILRDDRFHTPSGEHFAELDPGQIVLDFLTDGILLYMPPEQHNRVRRVFNVAFRANRIDEQQPVMKDTIARLVDQVAPTGACDFTDDISHQYSIEVLCRLLGVPVESIPTFSRATLDLVLMLAVPFEPGRERLQAALQALYSASAAIIAERRATASDDFISAVIAAQETEGRLTESELTWGVANLLFAGHDTTRYQLSSCVRALIEHGAWERVAADPQLVAAAIEEAMRFYPVVSYLIRVAAEDVELADVHVAGGTPIALNLLAATRDPHRFPDPARFNIDRDTGQRIPFGHGLHKCIGHLLAWSEMGVALQHLTARLTDVRIVAEPPVAPPTTGLRGPLSLAIEFAERHRS
jgi:cytochrome P450